MSIKNDFENYIKEGTKTKRELTAKANTFKTFGAITEDEYNEIIALINEHFGG